MFNKEEKKHYLLKSLIVIAILFFVAMAFFDPKPTIQHIEKQFNLSVQNAN